MCPFSISYLSMARRRTCGATYATHFIYLHYHYSYCVLSSFSKSGWTPLMRASLDGRTVAVESLLHRDDRVHLQEDVSAEYLIACL